MYHLDYQENGFLTGHLCLTKPFFLKTPPTRPTTISISVGCIEERKAVEDFIKRVYADSFRAEIDITYPVLMSVRDCENNILAALGFRYAIHENLFLEQYLDAPIEKILSVPRHSITEIGNLASVGSGISIFLFAAISAYLENKGQTHAVLTGTRMVEQRLSLMGLKPKRLASANPNRLINNKEEWGTYYHTDPHVLSGHVIQGYRRLQKVLGAEYSDVTPRAVAQLHYRSDMA